MRRVTQKVPRCRILVLSMHASPAYAAEALRCGAAGYALKAADAESLLRGIRDVAAGRRYLSPLLSEAELDRYAQNDEAPGLDPYDTLTERERQVMAMVAQGMTSAAIAKLLLISPRTVELHRANLLRKLGVKSHSALVLYALKKGMIQLDANQEVVKPPRSSS
jgi:DNA-binding NarL/FixJ family response regulator